MTQQNKNLYTSLFFIALFSGVLFFTMVKAACDSGDSVCLNAQYDANKAKLKALLQIIALKNRQGATLSDQIKSLEAQAEKLQLEIDFNKQKLDDLEGNITNLSSRIVEKEAVVNSQRQMLSELMRLYYSDYSDTSATLIFSSNETLSFLNQENWTTQLSGKVGELLDSVKTLRESLVGERVTLEEKKKEADALHMQLTARDEYLTSTKDNKAYLLTKTQAEVNKYDNLVDDLQKQQKAIEDEINDIESRKINQLSNLPSGSGQLAYPLKSYRVSQWYGTPTCRTCGYDFHNGIDFAASKGTKVLAAANGKIKDTGNMGTDAYGKWITIEHDGNADGLITLYGHLSRIDVSKGKTVKQGDAIGIIGNTGNVRPLPTKSYPNNGIHLHFTVYGANTYEIKTFHSGKNGPTGGRINPSKYLK
ncbi:MAG: peptidoglycan DD-metalloendopeptidase family protein [Candidatus Uhrbacteria bacterium]|nr:peptidoglycan DD-metalloendopeptidase family protein [Candidatus Uhrbacteria bacterium]